MEKIRFFGITIFGLLAIFTGLLYIGSHIWLWNVISWESVRIATAALGVLSVVGYACIRCPRNPVIRSVIITAYVWSAAQFILSLSYVAWFGLTRFFVIPEVVPWAVTVGTALYGYWNAGSERVRREVVRSPVADDTRIAVISDTHLGDVWGASDLEQIITRVNRCNAAITVIAGDLVDGMETVDEETFEPLEALDSPSYFITGNHDGYADRESVKDAVRSAGVMVLDEATAVENEVGLIGVGYEEGFPEDTETGTPVSVVVEHEPRRVDVGDVIISGHVHGGQIWPLGWLARLEFPYVDGIHEDGEQTYVVSSGARTWGPPLRLGTRSEIVVVDLVPSS
jgi:predicted MPP superfamily phosphohydrolase